MALPHSQAAPSAPPFGLQDRFISLRWLRSAASLDSSQHLLRFRAGCAEFSAHGDEARLHAQSAAGSPRG